MIEPYIFYKEYTKINSLVHQLQDVATTAFIGGGCPRDIYFDKPFSDIDIIKLLKLPSSTVISDARNQHALSVTDAGRPVLGGKLRGRSRAGSGRGSDPDDRSAMGVDGAAAGPALPPADRRQPPPAAGKCAGGAGANALWPGQLPAHALYWPANHLRPQRRHLYVRHAKHGAAD